MNTPISQQTVTGWNWITEKTKTFLTWNWVEKLFHWILTSGGTLAGIVFLLSGLWMSVLKAVPDFIQHYVNPSVAELLTYLSKTAFTGLPEIILFVATIKTLDQIKTVRVLEKGSLAWRMAITWSFLFGIPSIIFISFSLVNIGLSLASSNYTMPDSVVVGRGLTCFIYALLTFIYDSRGHESFSFEIRERDSQLERIQSLLAEKEKQFQFDFLEKEKEMRLALAEKEKEMRLALAEKEQELFIVKEESFAELQAKQTELNGFLLELSQEKNEKLRLAEKASSLVSDKLSYYPKVTAFLEKTKDKTITVDSIVELTGLSKRRINKAIAEKSLSLQSRNKEVLVSSLLRWLQDIPVPSSEMERTFATNGHNHHDQNTDPLELPYLAVIGEE